jgi:hypothetical protein
MRPERFVQAPNIKVIKALRRQLSKLPVAKSMIEDDTHSEHLLD